MNANAIQFGKFIKKQRKALKLTVRDVERMTGVSNSYLSLVENGKRDIPSPEILEKLSKGLQVPYEELMAKAGYLKSDPDPDYEYELEELLEKVKIKLNGKPFSEEDKKKILHVIEGVFWETHGKGKGS